MSEKAVEKAFRVCSGVYLLGAFERGVTLYKQQVRAHNLVWALWELDKTGSRKLGRVAVIGGGVAGLTVTAGLLALSRGATSVVLFERLWDLCPLQQGSDIRWLHPRIYEWPEMGSRAPSASLPVLNWSEGRASDVARVVVQGFGNYCQTFAAEPEQLAVFIGLRNFQLRAGTRTIDWDGTRAVRDGVFFQRGPSEGNVATFDTIILATGFGLERRSASYQTESYWRNEQMAQPNLDGRQRRHVLSGYGDGALVDLCRLTIERFRQDTIVYELFDDLENAEEQLNAEMDPNANLLPYFRSIDQGLLARARARLAARLRKDTRVTLHISGRARNIRSLDQIFGPTSSRLNRLLAYLLYRCGAFSISTSNLADCVRDNNVPPEGVLCRHGADTEAHLRAIVADYRKIERRLNAMRKSQRQRPVRLWKPGAFPIAKKGGP